jgi:hypothetical protein
MSPGLHRIEQDAADRQIRLALVAAALYVAFRGFVVASLVWHRGGDASLFVAVQHVVAFVLAAWWSYGLYRKRFAAALALFILWLLGYGYSWFLSERALPPLGLIGILMTVGLFLGVRGTYTYRVAARKDLAAI